MQNFVHRKMAVNHHGKDIAVSTLHMQNWKPSASFDNKMNLCALCPHRQVLKKVVCWGPRSIPISVLGNKYSVALEGTPEQLWRWDTKIRMKLKSPLKYMKSVQTLNQHCILDIFTKKTPKNKQNAPKTTTNKPPTPPPNKPTNTPKHKKTPPHLWTEEE